MSLIRDDDPPAFVSGLVVAFLIGCALATLVADEPRVTLRGRLVASENEAENGYFELVPAGDGDAIEIKPHGYLVEWLKGCVGRQLTVTLAPE